MTYLWTGSKKHPPTEGYNELVLCRDIFHCLPSELDEEDYWRVEQIIEAHNAEQDIKRQRDEAKAKHAKKFRKRGHR